MRTREKIKRIETIPNVPSLLGLLPLTISSNKLRIRQRGTTPPIPPTHKALRLLNTTKCSAPALGSAKWPNHPHNRITYALDRRSRTQLVTVHNCHVLSCLTYWHFSDSLARVHPPGRQLGRRHPGSTRPVCCLQKHRRPGDLPTPTFSRTVTASRLLRKL